MSEPKLIDKSRAIYIQSEDDPNLVGFCSMTSAWSDWHSRKEGIVEPDVDSLEQALDRSRAKRILDIGCGNGRHTVYFTKKGFEVSGFDGDPAALKRAKELLELENLHADLRVWDMTKPLPYQDAYFDAVLAVRVIHHTRFDNVKKIVREIDRVLRKSGYLFLQVPSYETEMFDSETVWAEPCTLIARGGPEKGVLHHFFEKDELLGLFPDYTVEEIHSGSEHYGGHCLIARKNKKNHSLLLRGA